jgi:hypothetical protein
MKARTQYVEVHTNGICGHLRDGEEWRETEAFCLYDSRTDHRPTSLAQLCYDAVLERGNLFISPHLMGLYIVKTTHIHDYVGHPFIDKDTTICTTYYPVLTPRLQRYMAYDYTTWQRCPLVDDDPRVTLRWSGEDEDLPALEDCLTEELESLWARVTQYQAPGEEHPDSSGFHLWDTWAEGWFEVFAYKVGWDRRCGFGNPHKIETGKDLVRFVNRHDSVGAMTFEFCEGQLFVHFSGHDTMNGTLLLTPCPEHVYRE